jgi:peptidoglycan-associated lipoprotein
LRPHRSKVRKKEGKMRKEHARLIILLVLAIAVALSAGCGRKVRPIEDQQAAQEAARRKAMEEEEARRRAAQEEEAIKPIQPAGSEMPELAPIHFDYDKYNLTGKAISTLSENATVLMEHPDLEITIQGHCDERGTDEYNLALGEKRALAARDFLTNFGIAKSRISVISYGEEKPVDPRHVEEAWAKNRRDEFIAK